MRPLALVLAITLIGSCVPVPTAPHAYVGNILWIAASTYAFTTANDRTCDYSREPDLGDAVGDKVGCELGQSLEMDAAAVVMALAVGGIIRTLEATYHGPATTKTSRSR